MGKESKIEIPPMEVETKPMKRRPGRPRKVRAAETEPTKNKGVVWATAKIPMVTDDALGYCARYSEIRFNASQSSKVKRMLLGLQREGVTVGARRDPIKSSADVIRYLIDLFPEAHRE